MTAAFQVLHVDDDADCVERLTTHLERASGFDVCSEPTVSEALDRIRTDDVDCIVSEYELPAADGLDLLKRVRTDWPDLPFILYTDSGSEAVASEAISAGVTEYVRKQATDCVPDQLVASVERLADRPTPETGESGEDRIARLVRTLQQDLVRATTREEIDAAVCDTLAEATPYVLAWIGDYQSGDERVFPRAAAGIERDYLDEIDVTVGDGATGRGPTGEAVRTQSLQFVQDISEAERYEPWRKAALDRGYLSSAAVPLVYEETFYGVLNVYADREGAFDERERALLSELGETISHAYHRVAMQQQYETQYRELFEQAPVLFAFTRAVDGEPVIDACNRKFAETLGYEPAELEGRRLAELYTEESAQELLSGGGYDRALGGSFVKEERTFRTKDGEQVTTLLRATPRRSEDGDVIGTHALFVDITERERAQEVLQQVEAMENSMDGVAILDEDETYVYANEAHADIYGYDGPEAFIGNTWQMCYDERERERFETKILPELEKTGEWRGEATGTRKDGTTFPQEASLTRVGDGNLICIVRDATERKEREEKLVRYREMVEYSTDVPTIIDPDGTITYVSPSVEDVLGYEPEELVGEVGYEYQHPDDRETVAAAIESVADTPSAETTIETRFRRADGSWAWIESRIRNLLDHDNIAGFLVSSRDISERKQREQELQELTEEYDAILENAEDAIFLIDVEGGEDVTFRFEQLSPSHEAISGLTTEDIRGKTPREALGRELGAEVEENYRRCVESRETITYEEELPMPEKTVTWQTKLAPVVVDDDVTRIVGIARDITERKERERELETVNTRLQLALEGTNTGVWERNFETDELVWDDQTMQLFGFDPEEFEGRYEQFDEKVHPDDIDDVKAAHERALDDGHYQAEYRIRPDDETMRWVDGRARVVYEDDEPVRLLGVVTDITERKQYEQRLKEQRDNLKILNEVVRHDIRNDLQVISAYAEILADSVDGAGQEYVASIRESAEHAVDLTTSARDIADVMLAAEQDQEKVSLRPVLEREVDELRSSNPDALVTVEGTLPEVSVVADDMLSSVFRNLLKNAVQHNDKAVTEIVTSVTERDEDVVVRVADNGPGVPDDQKEEIFGKGEKGLESQGTGIGLYLVQTLVDSYGGEVRVADNDPEGAVFTVTLPKA